MESSAKVDISFCQIVCDPNCQRIGFPTFVMCSNKSYSGIKDRVEDAGIEVDTVIENVGDLIRNGEEETRRLKRQVASMNWDTYQRCEAVAVIILHRIFRQIKLNTAVTLAQLVY